MKKIASLFVSAAAATTLLFNSVSAQESKKVVLMEQYTGAWCQWCPIGSETMEQLEEKYGDQFIGVKIHQGDGMADNALLSSLGNKIIPFYPSGGVDRTFFEDLAEQSDNNGAIGISANLWEQAVERRLAIKPVVDVSITKVEYDQSTRNATVTVKAKFLEDVTNDLRFNLYVIEDSVSGSGALYDQVNSLSGNPNYSNSKFYSLPRLIVGYQHRHTVRKILGGAAGSVGSIPANSKKDDVVEYVYTYKIPDAYKAYHISFVGAVQVYNTDVKKVEILNAAEMPLSTNIVSAPIAMNDLSSTVVVGNGNIKTGTVKNNSNAPVEVVIDIVNKNVIPSQWSVAPKQTNITIPAKGSVNVELDINVQDVAACIPIIVSATPVNTGEALPRPTTSTTWVMSDNSKFAVFSGLSSDFLTSSAYKAMSTNDNFSNKCVAIPFSAEIMKNLPIDKLEMGVFNLEGAALDIQDTDGTPMDVINVMLSNNKKVFVSAMSGLTSVYGSEERFATDAARDFYEKDLGITLGELTQRYSGNTLIAFNVTGIDGDPIGDLFFAKANTAVTNATYSLFTESIMLRPNTKSVASLYFGDNKEDIAAVRSESGDKRIVYFGFSPLAFASSIVREELLSNAYNWLLNGSTTSAEDLDNALANAFATPNPISGSNVTLSFDATVDGTSTFTVMNTLGQNVMTFDGNVQNGKNNVNLNVNNLTSGSYTVSAVVGGRILRIPFVVTK